jgi:hypothetical protein
MKKILLILLAVMTLHIPAQSHATEWSTTQKGLLVTALTLHTVDWGQTRTISLNPNKYYETNPILGRHPSTDRVNVYFAATALIIPTLAHLIPDWRSEILMLWVGVEATVTSRNKFVLGIKTSW